jgi:hypothetical protein
MVNIFVQASHLRWVTTRFLLIKWKKKKQLIFILQFGQGLASADGERHLQSAGLTVVLILFRVLFERGLIVYTILPAACDFVFVARSL